MDLPPDTAAATVRWGSLGPPDRQALEHARVRAVRPLAVFVHRLSGMRPARMLTNLASHAGRGSRSPRETLGYLAMLASLAGALLAACGSEPPSIDMCEDGKCDL